MADSTILPGVRARLVAPDGTTTREFYRFFSALSVTASLPGRVDDLTVRMDDLDVRVTELEHGGGAVRTILGLQSVKVVGPLEDGSVQLALDGDVISAPALSFYGALAEYGKGWQTFSGNFATLDNGDDTQSLDLNDLTDSGAGTFRLIARDAKGRVSGSQDGTSDDVPEGATNLYAKPITATAGVDLGSPRVVAVADGSAYYPDLTSPADVSRIVGVTAHAAAAGTPVQIVTSRDFSEPAWSWLPGRIYCALTGGALTQSAPATGAIVEVARVVSPTTIRVGIQPAILR